MNRDNRVVALISSGLHQFIAEYIMSFVDENLKNEQKKDMKMSYLNLD